MSIKLTNDTKLMGVKFLLEISSLKVSDLYSVSADLRLNQAVKCIGCRKSFSLGT